MRGTHMQPQRLFSYVNLEDYVSTPPLRMIRALTNEALEALSSDFDAL